VVTLLLDKGGDGDDGDDWYNEPEVETLPIVPEVEGLWLPIEEVRGERGTESGGRREDGLLFPFSTPLGRSGGARMKFFIAEETAERQSGK
jgi:hypothetical protein